ncbi:hypothetical protein [Reyranella massiliensis]|uniref:hypothetical protein n=1 Tax=Reyranella massiliensis TaxID=445220 RepID=UPI0002FC0C5D|nr:hypothetical protein [Reyranella massiliensis]
MARRILKVLAFGCAAALAILAVAPMSSTPDVGMLQVWLSLSVGVLVSLGVAASG